MDVSIDDRGAVRAKPDAVLQSADLLWCQVATPAGAFRRSSVNVRAVPDGYGAFVVHGRTAGQDPTAGVSAPAAGHVFEVDPRSSAEI